MKDIRKLKIWPLLESEGFKVKDNYTGNVIFSRSALLQPDPKERYPFIEIRPTNNNQWLLYVDYYDTSTIWPVNAFQLAKELPKELEKFKLYLKNHNNEN